MKKPTLPPPPLDIEQYKEMLFKYPYFAEQAPNVVLLSSGGKRLHTSPMRETSSMSDDVAD